MNSGIAPGEQRETSFDNLMLLCHRHHWLVHEGGRQVVKTDDHHVLAIPPSHSYQSWTRPLNPVAAA